MDERARSKMNTQIHEEACTWFVEARAGDLDDAGRRELDCWLRRSRCPPTTPAYSITPTMSQNRNTSVQDIRSCHSLTSTDSYGVPVMMRGTIGRLLSNYFSPRGLHSGH